MFAFYHCRSRSGGFTVPVLLPHWILTITRAPYRWFCVVACRFGIALPFVSFHLRIFYGFPFTCIWSFTVVTPFCRVRRVYRLLFVYRTVHILSALHLRFAVAFTDLYPLRRFGPYTFAFTFYATLHIPFISLFLYDPLFDSVCLVRFHWILHRLFAYLLPVAAFTHFFTHHTVPTRFYRILLQLLRYLRIDFFVTFLPFFCSARRPGALVPVILYPFRVGLRFTPHRCAARDAFTPPSPFGFPIYRTAPTFSG